MPKSSWSSSSSDLEALLKTQSQSDSGGGGGNVAKPTAKHATGSGAGDKEFVSLKRRLKLKQQEKYGRIRLGMLVLAIFFVICFSFVSNNRTYQPITVIVPHDDFGPKGECLNGVAPLKIEKQSTLEAKYEKTLLSSLLLLQKSPIPLQSPPATIANNANSKSNSARHKSKSIRLNLKYTSHHYPPSVPHGYLVYGPECKIPDIDPLAKDVMKLFHHEEYRPCSSKPPLTYTRQHWENDTVTLHLNFSAVSSYLSVKKDYLECCYQEIHRAGEYTHADDKFNLSSCISFDQVVELPKGLEFILVKCNRVSHLKPENIYTNGHALIRQKPEVVARLAASNNQTNGTRQLSVLLIGIDSISRLNLIRAMPNTAQYLYNNGWLELKGYNKMGDNTFPNLMAILTGLNMTQSFHECEPKKVGKLDVCPFLWTQFRDLGYATAYAEDEAKINTFNYNKHGFLKPPVDHYLRPFSLAIEKHLKISRQSGLKICVGYQNYADYIYQYAVDFATQYKGKPYFGLFWTNTFSHNDISSTSSMDSKIKEYLVTLNRTGILNDSLVVFFSDHGMRFGPVRELISGWFEERLPFIFFSFPPWFNETYPELVQTFKINRNRLTSPYDFHITLKNIASLAGSKGELASPGCPNCQSLFEEMPLNRSCADASIDQHWCTCIPYTAADKSMPEIRKAVQAALTHINNDLKGHSMCAKLRLRKILSAKIAKTDKLDTHYLVVFDVYPNGAKFEATMRYRNKEYHLTGSISRLNEYGKQSDCVHDDKLKKYCACSKH